MSQALLSQDEAAEIDRFFADTCMGSIEMGSMLPLSNSKASKSLKYVMLRNNY